MANEKAVSAWMVKKAQIDAILKRFAEASADHFNADPEAINWGHVGDISYIAEKLQEASDSLFQEGEYSPEVK